MNSNCIPRTLSLVGFVVLASGSLWAHNEGSSGTENWAALVGSQYRIH